MSESSETVVEEPTFRTMRFFPNWANIKDDLQDMADELLNSGEIIEKLSEFRSISYFSRFGKARIIPKKQFDQLIRQYGEQLPSVFSKVAQFVLREHTVCFPLFRKGVDLSRNFTKLEVLYLICSMVLCLIPKQPYDDIKQLLNYSSQLDFSVVFQSSIYKTKAIIEYVKQQLSKKNTLSQVLTIKRAAVRQNISDILKANSKNRMGLFSLREDEESIEEHFGDIKVDFANKSIGGGALGMGCVQEEIMFANHPQLHISMLLCEQMNPNQSILFVGFQKYSKNQGYSYQTKYVGKEKHVYEYDLQGRAKEYIVAIDALFLPRGSICQYRQINIKREILKAYCGFKWGEAKRVASGNWGCGAFGGNVEVKLIIQWIACALTEKELIYCPFGSQQQIQCELLKQLKSMNVGQVYSLLVSSGRRICNRRLLRRQFKEGKRVEDEQISIFKEMAKMIEQNNP